MNLEEEIKMEKFTEDLDKIVEETASNNRKDNTRERFEALRGFLKKLEELIRPSSEEKKEKDRLI